MGAGHIILNNAAHCDTTVTQSQGRGGQIADKGGSHHEERVLSAAGRRRDGDAGVSSVGSRVTAAHGFLRNSRGFGSRLFRTSPVRGSWKRKADPPPAEAQSSFLTAPPPFFPPPCPFFCMKSNCRHQLSRSFLSVRRPSGPAVPAGTR